MGVFVPLYSAEAKRMRLLYADLDPVSRDTDALAGRGAEPKFLFKRGDSLLAASLLDTQLLVIARSSITPSFFPLSFLCLPRAFSRHPGVWLPLRFLLRSSGGLLSTRMSQSASLCPPFLLLAVPLACS